MLPILMLCCMANAGYTAIPSIIPANTTYTVSANDVCNSDCTVMPGAALNIINGATATFKGHIFVKEHGKLSVRNSTVLMPVDGRIVLYADNDAANGYVGALLDFEGSKFSCSAPQGQGFWSGIEVMRNKPDAPVYNESGIYSDIGATPTTPPSLIERAFIGIRNYNKEDQYTYNLTSGGTIFMIFTTFRNNQLAVDIRNEIYGGNLNPVFNQAGTNWNGSCSFQKVDFIIDNVYNTQTPLPLCPLYMVQLINCQNITFGSCRFRVTNQTAMNTMIGIRGVNSSAYVYQYQATNSPNSTNYRCEFSGLRYGIHAINALETNKTWAIVQSDFHCTNDIYMSGCFKPYILYNRSYKDLVNINYNGETPISLFMKNCTGYTVESNTFYHSNTAICAGIVADGSGTAYNEIYRNFFPQDNAGTNTGLLLGIQSIGTNRNLNATTGLKFICNDLFTLTKGFDISVVKRPFVAYQLQTGQGISNMQFDQTVALGKSAANLYRNTDPANPTRNYYVENNTNTQYFNDPNNPFQYKVLNTNQILETPLRRSNFNVLTNASQNACPKKISVLNDIAAMPPYPYHDFIINIAAIEEQIAELEADPEGTQEEMGQLLTAQALLVDSIMNYYLIQYNMDTLQRTDYLDSVAMVYGHVNKGYQFKRYQASTYMGLNRMDDAIGLLKGLTGLSPAEAEEVSRVAQMYEVQQWLAENGYDWQELPAAQKERVYQYESEDESSAGAIARSLLAQYEDAVYDSYCIVPEDADETIARNRTFNINNKLYPNPASKQLHLLWKEGAAQFTLTDVTGRVLISKAIDNGMQQFDISHLTAGLYFAAIRQDGKIKYQQKIIKN